MPNLGTASIRLAAEPPIHEIDPDPDAAEHDQPDAQRHEDGLRAHSPNFLTRPNRTPLLSSASGPQAMATFSLSTNRRSSLARS